MQASSSVRGRIKFLSPCAHPPPRRGAAFYFPMDQIVMSMRCDTCCCFSPISNHTTLYDFNAVLSNLLCSLRGFRQNGEGLLCKVCLTASASVLLLGSSSRVLYATGPRSVLVRRSVIALPRQLLENRKLQVTGGRRDSDI